MKKVLAIAVVLLMVGLTSAQVKVGAGAFVGLPMGTFGDVTSLGFGGLVQGEMNFQPVVGTAQVGYLMFSGKSVNGVDLGSWSIIPVHVGAKYFFTPNIYGAASLGLNFISYTAKIPSFNWTTGTITYTDNTVSDTKFGFGIGAGYDMGTFDIGVKYQTYASDVSALTLTAIYKFTSF